MAKIVIYSKENCTYCYKAKNLIDSIGIGYQEIIVDNDEKMNTMLKLSIGKTFPQIFIDNKSIGGFDDLKRMHESGELQKII